MEANVCYLNPEIRARVLRALDKHEPRTIAEAARRSGTSRVATVRHLEQLLREGLVLEFSMYRTLRLFVLVGAGDA